jgi:hypothetical protein
LLVLVGDELIQNNLFGCMRFLYNDFVDGFELNANDDLCANALLTFDGALAAHLLDDLFADAHAEACTFGIHFLMLLQARVVLEDFI